MRALVFDRFGGPEVLEWREIADPVVTPGSALVRIASAGLNFANVYRRRGNYHMDATPPWVLGYEGAGEVAELSEEAWSAGFRQGDRVGSADSPRAAHSPGARHRLRRAAALPTRYAGSGGHRLFRRALRDQAPGVSITPRRAAECCASRPLHRLKEAG